MTTAEHGSITAQVVYLAEALCDPMRVQILDLLLQGRGHCCPTEPEAPSEGVCVCEITDYLGLIQSKVSYHLAKLKAVGLIREERIGKWNYYSVDRQKAAALLDACACFLGRSR